VFSFSPNFVLYTFLPNFPKTYLNLLYGKKKKFQNFPNFFGEEANKTFQEKNKTLLLSFHFMEHFLF